MDSSAGIAFLEFTDKDKQRLLEAYVRLQPRIPAMLDVFYDALDRLSLGPQRYGADLETLKKSQIEHWRHLFRGEFDAEYANAAWRIAIRHYEIGLPQDLYVMSYMRLLTLFSDVIVDTPGLEPHLAREMCRSVEKAIAIDMVHALAPYAGDLV